MRPALSRLTWFRSQIWADKSSMSDLMEKLELLLSGALPFRDNSPQQSDEENRRLRNLLGLACR